MADEVIAALDQFRGLLGDGPPVTAPVLSDVPIDAQRRLQVLPDGVTGDIADALVDDRADQVRIAADLATVEPAMSTLIGVASPAGIPIPIGLVPSNASRPP